MDTTMADDAQRNQGEPITNPASADLLAKLTDEQKLMIYKYLDEGFVLARRRRQVMHSKFSDAHMSALGADFEVAIKLHEEAKKQKLDDQNELNREKHRRQGAVEQLARQVSTRHDVLGRLLDERSVADHTRALATLESELDTFLADRLEILRESRDRVKDLGEQRSRLAASIRVGGGDLPVDVVDLLDVTGCEVVVVRLDSGEEVTRKGIDRERQLDLFAAVVEYEPMNAAEYSLAVAGRPKDAARGYAARLKVSEKVAKGLIRQQMPNADWELVDEDGDDLPPETGEAAPGGAVLPLPPVAAPEPAPPAELHVAITSLPVAGKQVEVLRVLRESKVVDRMPDAKRMIAGKGPIWPVCTLPKEQAEALVDKLVEAGCTCTMHPLGTDVRTGQGA